MRLESLDQVLDHGAKELALRQVPARWRNKRRGQIVLTPDGRLLLRPCCSASQASDTSKDGEQLMRHAASSGKLPLAGVVGHMQSTSWTTCLGCEKCRADRNACQRMHGSHDHVWVPDSLVWRALTCPHGGRRLLWQCVRRIPWSDVIDHAVTYGHFYVDPSQGTLSSDARGEHDGGLPRNALVCAAITRPICYRIDQRPSGSWQTTYATTCGRCCLAMMRRMGWKSRRLTRC